MFALVGYSRDYQSSYVVGNKGSRATWDIEAKGFFDMRNNFLNCDTFMFCYLKKSAHIQSIFTDYNFSDKIIFFGRMFNSLYMLSEFFLPLRLFHYATPGDL